MNKSFISTTDLQRNPKEVFQKNGFSAVLKDNKITGLLFTGEGLDVLLDSDFLQQVREELYETNDKKTQEIINDYRSGDKSQSMDFSDFLKESYV